MEAVLAFVPEEQRVQYSAMTGQSLFYMGETDLSTRCWPSWKRRAQRAAVCVEAVAVGRRADHRLDGQRPGDGRLVTHQYRVEGPVMIFLTTTAIDLDEELLNRCLVLTVNEDREQTQAIHRMQREAQTLEGLLARAGARRDPARCIATRSGCLKPVFVVNPYAPELTFLDTRRARGATT